MKESQSRELLTESGSGKKAQSLLSPQMYIASEPLLL